MLFCKIILTKFNSSFRHFNIQYHWKFSLTGSVSVFSFWYKASGENCGSSAEYSWNRGLCEINFLFWWVYQGGKETHLPRYTFTYILRISKGDCFWDDDLKGMKNSINNISWSANIPYHWRTAWHKTQSLWSGRSRPLPPSPTLTGSTRSDRLWDRRCMWRLPSPQRQWAP